ncbi:hypothetical protein D1007_42118 [Hordeum vulgare]|nr:hypothetical protein D1007_42118 [Hordeum vulgare]
MPRAINACKRCGLVGGVGVTDPTLPRLPGALKGGRGEAEAAIAFPLVSHLPPVLIRSLQLFVLPPRVRSALATSPSSPPLQRSLPSFLPCARSPTVGPLGGRISNFFFAPPSTNAEMSAPPADSWEGSVITEAHIEYLRRTRRISLAERVEVRVLGDECVPEPRVGDCGVFGTHFIVGFGLPASRFMRQFLEFYGLQMHHLGPNSVLYFACFTTLCEGYLGFWPFSSLFRLFFHFRAQKNEEVPYSRGGAVVYAGQNALFPKMRLIDSFKKWQRSFYIRSVGEGRDWVNLSPFIDEPLTSANWDLKVRKDEVTTVMGRVKQLKTTLGLMPADLGAAFISCRVLPLQEQPHRICDMGLRKDPCRLSIVEPASGKIAAE